jgi:hypothetical protein
VAYISTVPDALAALAAMLSAADALADVEVVDGPPVANLAAMEVVAIGYSPSEDVDAVEMTTGFGDLADSTDRETYIIHCSLGVINGDRILVAARERAYELFDAIAATVAEDAQLRKSVMHAGMGSHSLRQGDTDRGMLARINFDINCDAFTGR